MVAAAAGAAALLAACSDGGGGGGDGPTVVTVWDRAGAEADARQPFIEEWNRTVGAEEGIRIEYVPQAIERYEEIVRQGFQTDRAPDVFHAPSALMGGFVAAGWVAPIDDVVSEDVLAQAEPYLQDTSELVWGGRPYGIPTVRSNVRMIINRELFEQAGLDPDQPPETFSEVEDAARAITESGGGDAYGVALPVGWIGFSQWVVDLVPMASNPDLAQNGLFDISTGEYVSQDYEPVVRHYQRLIDEGWAYPGATELDIDTAASAFAEGEVGMILQGGAFTSAVAQLDSDVEMSTGPIPVADGEELAQVPMNAGFPYSISSTAEDPEAAGRVLEVFAGEEMQSALAEEGVPPLDENAWEVAVQANPYLEHFALDDLDTQWPKHPGGVIELEGEPVPETIERLVLTPDADVPGELDGLSQRYQQAFEEAIENGTVERDEFVQ
ncbi:ABC transporter substrate-binding protein [Georgenia alba]|uniref:ABC transporter substrate-binding protein n=1 Tax=Georgenia alba TaxID=2233858 RepID=A0ABW2QAM3_9MICO